MDIQDSDTIAWMTPAEAAKLSGVHKVTVYRWIREKKIRRRHGEMRQGGGDIEVALRDVIECYEASNQRFSLFERFWRLVEPGKPEDCWVWQGGKERNGYGRISDVGEKGNNYYAHRASWELTYGPIPEGMYCLHKCDNPSCVNPNHLWLGTYKDNMQDCSQKNRLGGSVQKGENNYNAKLTPSDVIQMRRMYYRGEGTITELARSWGINFNSAKPAILGITWKHIPDYLEAST